VVSSFLPGAVSQRNGIKEIKKEERVTKKEERGAKKEEQGTNKEELANCLRL